MKKNLLLLFLRAVVFAAVVAALVLAPNVVSEALGKNVHVEWLQPVESEWKGVLRVWNVYTTQARFDQSDLREAVDQFEAENRGVFIEYITLPLEGVESRLEKQSAPDIWIFPEGSMTSEDIYCTLSMPAPPEENVLTEDFEFDVGEIEEDEVIVDVQPDEIRFSVSVNLSGEAFQQAEVFLNLLSQITAID